MATRRCHPPPLGAGFGGHSVLASGYVADTSVDGRIERVTIAVSLKVNDGVVLAADSASTILGAHPGDVVNVYNHASKIFNLRKGLPIGLITWGLGGIGGASISTLAKDLRRRFTSPLPEHVDWELDPTDYTITAIANRVRGFFYDEKYKPAAEAAPKAEDDPEFPQLGFVVAGYSSGQPQAEEYLLVLSADGCQGPDLVRPIDEPGVSWAGQPEAITRLVNGHGLLLGQVLQEDFGLAPEDVGGAVELIAEKLSAPLVNQAMPFQDAIDLAEFLVHVSINWARFMPGSPVVGGPIETAAISKHEGQVGEAEALLRRYAEPGGRLMHSQNMSKATTKTVGAKSERVVPLQPTSTKVHSTPSTSGESARGAKLRPPKR
jgi:hypothetical protein